MLFLVELNKVTVSAVEVCIHVVIATLYYDGIEGLMKLASRNGFVPQEAYVNACHSCYEARKFLRTLLPEALVLLPE
jgi:hypothetical protein